MTSASFVSLFPQELIDKVIEENRNDKVALRASALVSRSFVRCSQSCLFTHIHLGGKASPRERSHRLYDVFLQSPHLCSYVRSLHIFVRHGSWISQDPSLIPIFSMLHPLMSFSFKAHRGRDFQWRDLPQPLRVEICRLCQRSRLIKVVLDNLGEFTEPEEFFALICSPTLADLQLDHIVLRPGSDWELVISDHRQARLTKCILNLGPTLGVLMCQLARSVSFSHLRYLSFVWHPEATVHLQNILDTSIRSLQRLTLTIARECASVSVPRLSTD
jgi:hypothetical protein